MPITSRSVAISVAGALFILSSPGNTMSPRDHQRHIAGTGEDYAVTCKKGQELSITGSANNVSVEDCTNVTIAGSSNNVVVKNAASIAVSGASNDLFVEAEGETMLAISGGSNDMVIAENRNANVVVNDLGLNNTIQRVKAER